MAHIYWELHEIPRPEESYINHSDGRVFLMSDDGFSKKKRRVIGRATSETMMHPNDLYKYLYPQQWKEFYGGKELARHELHVGMYALALGIGYNTNLYPLLQETYGPLYGNSIVDYAMFSILDRTDTTQLFTERMSGEVLFSKEAYSDSWYSELFNQHMSEDLNHQFRCSWLKECARRGTSKVWLSIDGSNNDCAVQNSELPSPGKAKSNTNSNIVSYLWAIDAENGRPVTYFVNNGGTADSKSFQVMAALLCSSGIEISGVILDRAFCTHDVFQMVKECGYPYIIMLKSDTYGHTQMMEQYASEIRWNVRHIIGDKGVFGIAQKGPIFGNHPEEAWLNLYFDGVNGTGRSVSLIKKIRTTAQKMNEQIRMHIKPSVPKELSAYLSIKKNGRSWKVEYNYDAWQKALDSKGYCSIASSDDFGPEMVDYLYHLRDASEKQYMIMKSQLGYDTTRVHSTESIEGKSAVCFIASILRAEVMIACQNLGFDTNQMLREIDRASLILMTDGLYTSVNNLTGRQKALLQIFDVEADYFKQFADEVNRRKLNPINSQIHRLPNHSPENKGKKRGRPPKPKIEVQDNLPQRKPGRPKGSKNKKTLEREATLSQGSPVKRRPGRPKGSKNKSNIDEPKRSRGRPRKTRENQYS